MREVFLDELPRDRRCRVDWKNSVGYKVKFIYDDVNGEVEIVGYDIKTRCLTIKYNRNTMDILPSNFKKCQLGNILGKITNDFKVEIGTNFKDSKRDITIIDREIREVKRKDKKCKKGYTIAKQKWYKYHCNKGDNNEDWIIEHSLLGGCGCNVCSGDKVTEYNCMWNTDRELCVMLGIPKEVAETVTRCSSRSITFNCKCGNPVTVMVSNIIKHKSIGCKKCSDGISYPNKFIHEFCNQLLQQKQIKYFETEYTIEDKKYDIYIILNNNKTLIIENHGVQHGEFIYNGNLLLVKNTNRFKINENNRDDIKNDIYKCRLAYNNNINNYIQLDCSVSDVGYIKNSAENSWLSKMFDLTNIDWLKCHEYALKNIVKEVCDYWHKHVEVNNENITTKSLSKIFNCSCTTIISYLHKGYDLGWCNYNPNQETINKIKDVCNYWKEHREINNEYITTKNLVDIFNLNRSTITKYLKQGTEFGWCYYNPKEESKTRGKSSGNSTLIYDLNMNYIGYGESASWIQEHSIEKFGVYLDSRRISEVATSKKSSYKGFIFKYEKDVDK